MTTTTLAPLAPAAVDAQLDEAPQTARSGAGPSRGLWRLQMFFLALGLVIDFVAFSAALQVLDSQMVQWQAWLIAACGGALALFLMFEAGHLEVRRTDTTKGRHGRALIRLLIFVWLLAGVAATYIRVTTPPAGTGSSAFESTADSAGWDLGLFTVYPDALPMALFMFVLYLGVGISAYIAGLKFEEHRQPSTWLTNWRERKASQPSTWLTRRRERKALAKQRKAEAAERDRLGRNLAAELDRLEKLHAERGTLTVRLSQLKAAKDELAEAAEQLQAHKALEAALDSLETARAVRQELADEHLDAQQRAAGLPSHLEELPGQIDREKRAAQERGRYASEHARQVLSRGLGDPAKTVMGIDDSADEDPTHDPRTTR